MEGLKYKDANGNIVSTQFDPSYPIKTELSSDTVDWEVEATSLTAVETTEFHGPFPKK